MEEVVDKKEMEKNNKYKNWVGTAILVVFVFVLGIFVGRSVNGTSVSNFLSSAGNNVDMSLFWQVWNITTANYVDDDKVNEESMIYGAIEGMVDSIGDEATVFLDPESTETYNASNSGKYFEGIGAELGYKDGSVIVVSPISGSPAEAAGIRAGDYILKIDDYELTSEDSVYDAVAKIRGESGTTVTLTVLHIGDEETTEIPIVREEITVASMSLSYVGENSDVALLDVSRFTESSLYEWESEWNSMVDEIKKSGVTKMILDLRGNPGGYFDAAIYAADEFLGDNVVVAQQKDANGKIEKFYSTKKGSLEDIELVVLVNVGSASSSEILTGALQQSDRATVIGTSTYGKGTAQKVYDLSDGSSLHLTILKWLLPDGTNIDHDNPIVPDIEVEYTDSDFRNGNDTQLNRAIDELSN